MRATTAIPLAVAAIVGAATANAARQSPPTPAPSLVAYNFAGFYQPGGACDGLRASDVAILAKTSTAIVNIGAGLASITCHAPNIGHVLSIEAVLENTSTTDARVSCTLVAGYASPDQPLATTAQRYPEEFDLSPGDSNRPIRWGIPLMDDNIDEYIDAAQWPFRSGVMSLECVLPPHTQLDGWYGSGVRDIPKIYYRHTP